MITGYEMDSLTYQRLPQHVYFRPLDISHFQWKLPCDSVYIQKGFRDYYYYNIYEVLLWYAYYSSEYHHIDKHRQKQYGCWQNRGYFSRICQHYRQCDPMKGLNIVKEALDILRKRHGGLPKYYQPEVLSELYYIK